MARRGGKGRYDGRQPVGIDPGALAAIDRVKARLVAETGSAFSRSRAIEWMAQDWLARQPERQEAGQ